MFSRSIQERCLALASPQRLVEFSFDDESISDEQTLLGVLAMFKDCQVVEKYNLDYQVKYLWNVFHVNR